jgi:hypothetical protein
MEDRYVSYFNPHRFYTGRELRSLLMQLRIDLKGMKDFLAYLRPFYRTDDYIMNSVRRQIARINNTVTEVEVLNKRVVVGVELALYKRISSNKGF